MNAGEQAGNAADIVRPGLQAVGQVRRHGLHTAVGAGAAIEQRLALLPAEQKSRSLGTEQALVSGHGDKGCAPACQIHRQHSSRLRGVHDQRDPILFT